MDKDMLIIKRETFSNEDYMKSLKISPDLHGRVKKLADETNRPISGIACMLVEFALDRALIEE